MIKPYFEASGITLYEGDCLSILPQLADSSVDAVVTDPPYGLDIAYGSYIDSQDNLQHLIDNVIPQLNRLAALTVLFPGINNITKYPTADWVGCWFYGTTGSWGKFGYNAWQPFLLYGTNNNRYGMDAIKYSSMEKRIEGHPCSKPLGLMKLLVARFSNYGDTILDPFMGSGTTGLACLETGRNFIGIDIERSYLDMTIKRIEPILAQGRLEL